MTIFRHPFKAMKYKGEQFLGVLHLAHKYCMDEIENEIISMLEEVKTTEGYVDLMVASQVVSSKPVYQKALDGLYTAKPFPSLEQAKRIGVEAMYAIVMGRKCPKCGQSCKMRCIYIWTG
jgi:hypothetical protein